MEMESAKSKYFLKYFLTAFLHEFLLPRNQRKQQKWEPTAGGVKWKWWPFQVRQACCPLDEVFPTLEHMWHHSTQMHLSDRNHTTWSIKSEWFSVFPWLLVSMHIRNANSFLRMIWNFGKTSKTSATAEWLAPSCDLKNLHDQFWKALWNKAFDLTVGFWTCIIAITFGVKAILIFVLCHSNFQNSDCSKWLEIIFHSISKNLIFQMNEKHKCTMNFCMWKKSIQKASTCNQNWFPGHALTKESNWINSSFWELHQMQACCNLSICCIKCWICAFQKSWQQGQKCKGLNQILEMLFWTEKLQNLLPKTSLKWCMRHIVCFVQWPIAIQKVTKR